MFGGKNQSGLKPTALGTLLQASTYGMTIPVIYGMTQSPLLAIWANNIRPGTSGKKGKASKKTGLTDYVENIDFLLGHNPILDVIQMWNNNDFYQVNFTSAIVGPGSVTAMGTEFTISDSHFAGLIAVTIEVNFGGVTFDDYGGQGPVESVTSFAVPLWNALIAGPDPMNGNCYQDFGYCYLWQPSFGANFYILADGLAPFNVTAYYAQLTSAANYASPLARNRMEFEPILGSGSEYEGFSEQQIQYPWYAGIGSPNLDLGSSATVPSLKAEVLGQYTVYPTGDADFVDMIQDIVKNGQSQAAIGSGLGASIVQVGVNCYDFPGAIQKKNNWWDGYTGPLSMTYDQPNTQGNALLATLFLNEAGSNVASFTDSLGNDWSLEATLPSVSGVRGPMYVYQTVNCAGGTNTVTFSANGLTGYSSLLLMEIPQVDSFDGINVAAGAQPSVSLTTTNQAGKTELLYTISLLQDFPTPAGSTLGYQNLWPIIAGIQATDPGNYPHVFVQQRYVTNPGTFTQQWNAPDNSNASAIVITAFKSTVPANYVKALPDIIDPVNLNLTRNQCRAGGLWGALTMDSQQSAQDWIKMLTDAADCAPVWSGFQLKLIPRSEVSAAANGAIYYSPTSTGPVANVSTETGDFVSAKGAAPIQVIRKARIDVDTVLQMQHISRASQYQQVVTAVPDPAGIALYGLRKADPVTNNAVQDVAVARMLLQIMIRRQNYIDPVSYKFTLKARWQLLEAMDLILISDPLANVNQVPVRLTQVNQTDQSELECTAEPFVYGINAPQTITVTQPQPYNPDTTNGAGNVNTPIIFEPTARLSQGAIQIWFVVSSSNPNYSGCQIYISTDGGNSYNILGTCSGNGTTGVSTSDWPASPDPDTTDNLPLNLAESLGSLLSYQVSDENNFTYPCYIAGGTTLCPYELMTYSSAVMTATYAYTLNASASTSGLRRAVFGAPGSAGVDHPTGSRFAFLMGEGICKATMDPNWIGKTLYFKFLSVNSFGTGAQSLSDVSAYSYVPVGTGLSGNLNTTSYSLTPATCLSNPTSTTIQMAQVSCKFPTNTVNYNARTFTIPAPSEPTMYYVTLADPGFIGDTGGADTLTATCQTSDALVGAVGNTYMGSIQALPAGGGTIIAPGGLPVSQLFVVNGS